LNQKFIKTPLIIVLFILGYAIIRYNFFKGISLQHLPVFILNKSISATAAIMISLSFYPFQDKARKIFYGIGGFFLSGIHLLMSFLVLNPVLFAKFYENNALNIWGESSLAFGIFAFAFLALSATGSVIEELQKKSQYYKYRWLNYAALVGIQLHLIFTGIRGWFDIKHWPGSLPPITLVSFLAVAGIYIASMVKKKTTNQENRSDQKAMTV